MREQKDPPSLSLFKWGLETSGEPSRRAGDLAEGAFLAGNQPCQFRAELSLLLRRFNARICPVPPILYLHQKFSHNFDCSRHWLLLKSLFTPLLLFYRATHLSQKGYFTQLEDSKPSSARAIIFILQYTPDERSPVSVRHGEGPNMVYVRSQVMTKPRRTIWGNAGNV